MAGPEEVAGPVAESPDHEIESQNIERDHLVPIVG